MLILSLWTIFSSLTILLLGIHPARTWVTFGAFLLPALIPVGWVISASAVHLLNPRALRRGTWKLFGRVGASLWPARVFLMVQLVCSLLGCALLIWEFLHF